MSAERKDVTRLSLVRHVYADVVLTIARSLFADVNSLMSHVLLCLADLRSSWPVGFGAAADSMREQMTAGDGIDAYELLGDQRIGVVDFHMDHQTRPVNMALALYMRDILSPDLFNAWWYHYVLGIDITEEIQGATRILYAEFEKVLSTADLRSGNGFCVPFFRDLQF